MQKHIIKPRTKIKLILRKIFTKLNILHNKPVYLATHLMVKPDDISFETWEELNNLQRLAHMQVIEGRVLIKGESDV